MIRSTLAVAVTIAFFGVSTAAKQVGEGSVATRCAPRASFDSIGPVKPDDKNTIVFDHRTLTARNKRLLVLEVDHGGFFQIIFDCTAPEFFEYKITGDSEPNPDGSRSGALNESVEVNPSSLVAKGVTMRHDSRFMRYHVSARLRPGVVPAVAGGRPDLDADRALERALETIGKASKPSETWESAIRLYGKISPLALIAPGAAVPAAVLYGVEFDIWVTTAPEWKLGVIGGVGFSPMVDEKFYIKPGAENRSTFEKAPDVALDRWRNDVIALANGYYSRTYWRFLNVGAAFGIGTSGGAARYFMGPSLIFGRYFVFSPGLSIGNIATAPIGQVIGETPINGANTLNTLSSRRVVKPSLAIGFTWIDRKDQFAAALAAASATGGIGSCVASVAPTELAFDEPSEKQVTVTAGDDCAWVATLQKSNSGFQVKGGSGKGKGAITIVVADQPAAVRTDTLNVVGPFGSAAKPVKLSQAAKSCVEAVGDGKEIVADGSQKPIPVAVKAVDSCKWSAIIDGAGFKAEPATGQGTATLNLTPPAQGAADQTGTLSVVGPQGATPKTVTIKQPKKG